MKYQIKIIAIIFSYMLIQSCNNAPEQKVSKDEITINTVLEINQSQFSNIKIQSDTIQKKLISGSVRVNGKIDVPPQNLVSISISIGGYLISTKLLPGMFVKKGEVIAVLEDQQYIQLQQDYLTSNIQLDFLEKEFNRQNEMNLSKASSDKIFEKAKADFQSQKVLVQALSEKLKLIGFNPKSLNVNTISKSINIYAPINGFVSKVNVNIGKYITPSDVLFELVNPDDMHLNLTVFEKDLPSISIGNEVLAYTNQSKDKLYKCEIILIGKNINKEGFVEVHCHFKSFDKDLVPGMFMNAEVEFDARSTYVVPENAILSYQGEDYVFIQNSALKFEIFKVQIGQKSNGMIELINFQTLLKKQIVISGAYDLLMMLKNKED